MTIRVHPLRNGGRKRRNRKYRQEGALAIHLIVGDSFCPAAFSLIVDPLLLANRILGEERYRLNIVSEKGGQVTSGAFAVKSLAISSQTASNPDFILVCDSVWPSRAIRKTDVDTEKWLKESSARGVPICLIGDAVFWLAAQNMAVPRTVSVPWHRAQEFADSFPDCTGKASIIDVDEHLVTCAGGMATFDFTLLLLRETAGVFLSAAVAEHFIHAGGREADTKQRPAEQGVFANERVQQLLKLTETAPVYLADDLAKGLNLSSRQTRRLAKKHLKSTPSRLLRERILERSREMLRESDLEIGEIAVACGFDSQSHFTKRYKEKFGRLPSQDRMPLNLLPLPRPLH